MKIEDLVMLSRAGFTKDEIMSFVNQESQPQQLPEVQPEQLPEVKPEAKPEQLPEVKQQLPDPADKRLEQLETKLDYVINRFNYLAVQQSQMPDQKTESVEDILSSVVRGTKPDK